MCSSLWPPALATAPRTRATSPGSSGPRAPPPPSAGRPGSPSSSPTWIPSWPPPPSACATPGWSATSPATSTATASNAPPASAASQPVRCRRRLAHLDANLCELDKERAAATWKKGYGFHPLGAWCRNTAESLAMLLRPGNAGSNTFADHAAVLTAAIRQIPVRMRTRMLVRVDGAGASHELLTHLLSLATARRHVLFTCGWMITPADEQAIGLLPATAWQAAVDQDGVVQEDKHVAEITYLMSRAGNWPSGLRWIVRRTRPSRRQARNLTAFERATGWRYSIIVTNIPAARGIGGVPGSHHAPFIDVLHREHAVVEDQVRTNKAMGLRNLPAKTWVVNCGWVLAASLAADLAAWCRLLGLYDCDDLKDAEPGTLRYRLLSPPAPAC